MEGAWTLYLSVDTSVSYLRIHRYVEGGAITFSGQDLIKESDYGVVAVIIQYRLGVFGFLPGSEIRANGSLNAGLRKYCLAVGLTTVLRQ